MKQGKYVNTAAENSAEVYEDSPQARDGELGGGNCRPGWAGGM